MQLQKDLHPQPWKLDSQVLGPVVAPDPHSFLIYLQSHFSFSLGCLITLMLLLLQKMTDSSCLSNLKASTECLRFFDSLHSGLWQAWHVQGRGGHSDTELICCRLVCLTRSWLQDY